MVTKGVEEPRIPGTDVSPDDIPLAAWQ